MPLSTCNLAQIQCSFGSTPGILNILPNNKMTKGMFHGTIMNAIPFTNITPCGMCMSPANPAVAAATAAALGVLTPMPCTPMITGPWILGDPTVLINNMPILTQTSKAICAYGGVVQILNPNEISVQVKT